MRHPTFANRSRPLKLTLTRMPIRREKAPVADRQMVVLSISHALTAGAYRF